MNDLDRLFETLLNASGSRGVGLVDENGLLVHSSGEHAGFPRDRVGALLHPHAVSGLRPLESVLEDTFGEQLLLGDVWNVFLLRFEGYLLYALAPKEAAGGRVRFCLREAREQLKLLLRRADSAPPAHQRLQEPRQFKSPVLDRQLRADGAK